MYALILTDSEYGRKKKSKSDAGRRRSSRNRKVLYDDMDDFVVSGSDSEESYSHKRSKKKSRSRGYRDDSWDSDVTSDESYSNRKSATKRRPTSNKKSKSKKKTKAKRYSDDSDVEFESKPNLTIKDKDGSNTFPQFDVTSVLNLFSFKIKRFIIFDIGTGSKCSNCSLTMAKM